MQVEPGFLEYESVEGVPFTASYLDISKVFPELRQQDVSKVRSVERYVRDQVESGKFVDTASAAREIFSQIEKGIGLSVSNDPFYRLDRMAEWVSVSARRPAPDQKIPRADPVRSELRRLERAVTSMKAPETVSDRSVLRKVERVEKVASEVSKKVSGIDLSPIKAQLASISESLRPLESRMSSELSEIRRAQEQGRYQAQATAALVSEVVRETQALRSRQTETKSALSRLLEGL